MKNRNKIRSGRKVGHTKFKVTGNGKIGLARKLNNRKNVIGLFIIASVLILILIILILINFGFFENHKAEKFNVQDECLVIVGNLVHQIRDNGECRIGCVNECDVQEMNFVNFSYEGKTNGCNSCECWCE